MTVRQPALGVILLLCTLWFPLPATGNETPLLTDDLSTGSLRQAVNHSLNYLRGQPPERTFQLCDGLYDNGWLTESLTDFADLLDRQGNTGEGFAKQVREQFEVCSAQDRSNLLVTGYYEPEMAGSLTRTATFRYPLYRVPPDLVSRDGRTGRMDNGRFSPYWSRREIEEGNKLKGLELAYLADPVDCFILHVQGSGRIRLPDGTIRRVHFAAKNGRPYRSIGRLLIDEGKMSREEVTMPSLRAYLAAHPQEVARVLQYNQSFIFFNWGSTGKTPTGNIGEPLTAGRSVALDQSLYPPGALGYLLSEKPQLDSGGQIAAWQPMGRFVLNQDTGSAIRGANRLDLFWGTDHYAEIAAGNMKQSGKLYFLIKKQRHADNQQRGQL
ncbi:MAG: MltA domain-containing protein [Desulfobulbaceae bacterium]|nr:MltA domain-containing protein [Desulfobulbaceae bacterium]